MKHITLWLGTAIFSLTATSAMAESLASLGIEVGGGFFISEIDGDVVSGIDVDNELDIEDIGNPFFYVNFEHPLPIIPKIRLARTHIDEEGEGRLASGFTYEGRTFNAGDVVRNKVDFSHTDVSLYYDLWDVSGDFDIGLTARWFEGEVDLAGTVESAEIVLPMVYANARIDLPFSGFYLGALANAGSISGDSITDAEVKVGWRKDNFILPEFGVELGYRIYSIDVEESVNIDLDLSGAFITFKGHL